MVAVRLRRDCIFDYSLFIKLLLSLFVMFFVSSLFGYAVLCVLSSFPTAVLEKRECWLLYLYSNFDVMWLLLFLASLSWCGGLVNSL